MSSDLLINHADVHFEMGHKMVSISILYPFFILYIYHKAYMYIRENMDIFNK